MRYTSFSDVIEKARKRSPVSLSVAAAEDLDVLAAVKEAIQFGIVNPVLVGDQKRITELSESLAFPIRDYKIIPAATEEEAAYIAAKLADEGHVQGVMKGMMNSSSFLKGVLHKELSLKTGRTFSHISAFDIPGSETLIFMTDGGLNILPSFEQKKQIIINAVDFLKAIGLNEPRVALLAANERIMDKMPVTIEAKCLAEAIKKEYQMDLPIEGPLPLDCAISPESLLHKGIESRLKGKADLLVVPNIEAGNILGKAITYFAGGTMAGIVTGAKVPLILNSRSDSAKSKLASIALAAISVSNSSEGMNDWK